MLPNQLATTTLADIERLKTNAVAEGRFLDYKRDLPGNSNDDRKEFLRDLTSFANTNGGDLIYGVSESGGVPEDIVGCEVDDLDVLNQQWQNLIRDGIEPPPTGLEFHSISFKDSRHIVVLRVPESWQKPHRVKYKSSSAFYARNAVGKYPVELGELRQLFTLGDTLTQRLRAFRQERVAQVMSGRLPVTLQGEGAFVMHVVPVSTFSGRMNLDMRALLVRYCSKRLSRPWANLLSKPKTSSTSLPYCAVRSG